MPARDQPLKFGLRPSAVRVMIEANTRRNMAKRLDIPDVPLTPEALAELRQRYAMLSTPSLQQVYSDALERCKLDRSGRPPRAEQFQVLVTAWKMLRKGS